MSDYIRSLSLRLCEIMDNIGVSEEIRKINMGTSITTEIAGTLRSHLTGDNETEYIFGSTSEGSSTAGLDSDMDLLMCDERYPVFENMCEVLPDGRCLLLTRDDITAPGYVKLHIVHDSVPRKVFNARYAEDKISVDRYGRWVRNNKSSYRNDDLVDEENGPAATRRARPGFKSIDYVEAYRCKTCLSFASNWITRLRLSNIYPQDLIDLLNSYGCFFVPIGYPFSEEKNLEWRISFSLQERQLMFRLTPVQFKCYVLLKIIKKDLIKREMRHDSLSSYHCKTCILYMVEILPAELWTPDNLMKCLFYCMNTLMYLVNVGFCPNYFIKEENMFARKIQGDLRVQLYQVIQGLLSEGCPFLLRIRCDGLGEQIARAARNPCIPCPVIRKPMFEKLYLNILSKKANCSQFKLYWCQHICMETELRVSLEKSLSYLRRLQCIDVISEHSEVETKSAIISIIPHIKPIIAQNILTYGIENIEDVRTRRLCLSLILKYLNTSMYDNTNDMSICLGYISILHVLGRYDVCEKWLQQQDRCISILCSKCICRHKEHTIKQTLLNKMLDDNLTLQEAAPYFTTDVFFPPQANTLLPDALRYEMFRSVGTPAGTRHTVLNNWYDWAVVDAKVFLFFMQYLVYRQLNKNAHTNVAIDNMEWVIKDDPNLNHKETAYNLLGWIYVQENRIGKAITCFVKSWKIQSLHNAAKWHIIELLSRNAF